MAEILKVIAEHCWIVITSPYWIGGIAYMGYCDRADMRRWLSEKEG